MNSGDTARSFPWTYDQLQRYAVLRLLVEELGNGKAGAEIRRGESRPFRILDVGGAAADRPGTGFWLPARAILAGLEFPLEDKAKDEISAVIDPAYVYVADVSACIEPGFVRASGMRLPFKTGAFDIVSAFDVLEHIPKDAREQFLREIGRIASRAVLLSCPTKSPGVEQAEALLNAEIKRLYGIEHGMLAEHRERGLPREEEVATALTGAGLTAVSFGYGALSTWLTYLIFRSSFLMRGETDRATEAIDRYWVGQPQAAELSAPFYRRFWIGSKMLTKGDIERMEAAMKDNLARGLKPILEGERSSGRPSEALPISPDEFNEVEQVTRRILERPFVSAVIVTMGEPSLLRPCLDTILTQIVDFDLEVTVWNVNQRPDTAAWLTASYPQVRRFEGKISDLIGNFRGDYIFLVDEKLQPSSDAVARYVDLLKSSPSDSVLAVSAPWRGGFPKSWIGMTRNFWKKSKGLSVKAGIVGDTSQIREDFELAPKFKGWVIGDALFFRRLAVHSRKNQDGSDKNSIFLWEFK